VKSDVYAAVWFSDHFIIASYRAFDGCMIEVNISLYTSIHKSTELVFLKNKFVVLVYVYSQYPVHIYLAVFIEV
jgi:hypothetical protein